MYTLYLFRTLLYHSHNLTKQAAYYLEAPPLPPEDLEPPPEKVEEKPVEPITRTKEYGLWKKETACKEKAWKQSNCHRTWSFVLYGNLQLPFSCQ